MQLRDYQLECLKAIESKQDGGIHRQMVVLPTGAGKTVIFSELIKDRNLKTLVIAHRIELLEQARDKLKTATPEMSVGIFCGDEKCHDKQVTIASIQSASRPKALEILKEEGYQLLIIDEAHHAAAKTYRELIEELGFLDDPEKLLVGFTATPKRGDNVKLDDLFQEIVYTLNIEELVKEGYLVKPKGVHIKLGVDLEDVQKQMGDFQKASLRDVMNSKNARFVVTSAIKEFAKECHGIVFAVDIQHAEDLRDDIIDAGFSCAAVHSRVSSEERKAILKDFADGRLQFVTNPMILTEGFDCPRANCMINAAPTMNRSLYIQKAGRVLRLHPNKKDALLIDFGKSTQKNELCTAATLMGKHGYVEVDVVTEEDQLFSEADDKNKALELEIIVDASIYDPLTGGFAFKNSTEEKLFTPKYWITGGEIISEKQRKFLKTLGKATKLPLPKKKILDQMSMEQASRCIKYLKAKKEHLDSTTPLTEKQRAYINHNICWDTLQKLGVSSIKGLTKKKAQRLIGSFKKMEIHHQNSYVY